MRKTAVVCVAKLYDIAPELVEDRGFLETLQVRAPHTERSLSRCARAFSHALANTWVGG